ncbi:MAG TPA: hypothetical protein VL463_31750 [Kofleriaceae bacterium]|nr:hypothetical protein [Kofleriaceae bacterium]
MSLNRDWPARDAICLQCRTALPRDTRCPHGHDRACSPREPAGREALLTEVWGPPPVRTRIAQAARAGGVGGSASLIDACGGCGDVGSLDGWAFVAAIVVFLVVAIAWLVIALIRDRMRRRAAARGAQRLPVAAPTGLVGVIAPAACARDPIDGVACVAFGVELRQGTRTVTLRDGATVGFDVVLDSGERVRVPPGACAIDLRGVRATAPDRRRLDALLGALDPLRATSNDLDPCPHDRVFARTIRPGDRVEVLGPVVAMPDPTAQVGSYRESPRTLLVPDGAPRLRIAGDR